jgi:integration host factor subunit alpha
MTLTKAELAGRLVEQWGMDKQDAKSLVDHFFEEIKTALQRGETVKLSGFGHFDLRDKNSRPGRNPKTGEVIPVTARRVVTFKMGPKLKTRVSQFSRGDRSLNGLDDSCRLTAVAFRVGGCC